MSPAEKRLARRTAVLGILLTFIVVVADAADLLRPLDQFLYDQRARHCQFFAPPPTDDLVYIDIDDQSLDAIGEFPWPRDTLAPIVDEIGRAGAKVIAFDIIFDKPQPRADPALAEACRHFTKTLLPVSFELKADLPSDTYALVLAVLMEDLELSPQQVSQRLRDRGNQRKDLDARVQRDFPEAIREAMYERIAAEVPEQTLPDPEILRKKLLPRTSPAITESYLLHLLATECERVQGERTFRRFARKPLSGEPPLLPARRVMPPVSVLGSAASATGYVDYLPLSDGVVRSLPLFVQYKGGVYPQAGLALACAMLDIDPANPQQVVIAEDVVTLHPATRPAIRLPVRSVYSPRLEQSGSAFLDVPWYGSSEWSEMYVRYRKNPHVLINDIWQLAQSRRAIRANCVQADDALKRLLARLGEDRVKAYETKPLPPDDLAGRAAMIQPLLDELKESGDLDYYKGKTARDFTDIRDQQMVASISAAQEIQTRAPVLLQMIKRQEDFLRSRLQNRAALVGYVATAVAASDFVPTSLHPRCPGVIIHGAIFNGIMTGELWRTAPRWVGILTTFLIGLFATAAVALLSPWKAVFATLSLVVVYLLVNGILLFDYLNILIDPGAGGVIAAAGLVFAGCILARLLIEGVERARITARFRAYNDPALVDEIVDNPALETQITAGQSRVITVVFADLVNSTALFERVGPGIVSILNRYFSRMVPLIRSHRGYVNKFNGDGIMFFFNAPRLDPEHPLHAVHAVHDMQRALASFNEELAAENLPTVGMRAGIATDTVIVGDAGATDRSDYTALGDAVNLASRLEGANKMLGTSNLLTQATADAIGDRFLLRPIGNLQVVGKNIAVMTYEAVCPLTDATDAQKEMVALTIQMVQSFTQSRFADCITLAADLEQKFGPHKLTSLYRSLATLHQSTPPSEPFEGRIILAEK